MLGGFSAAGAGRQLPCWPGVRLRQIRRTRLLSGGALVSGISGAFFALDIGLARDIVVERRAVEIGHVKPQRGQGLGVQALTWREWQRLRRFPQPLLVLAATVVVPYAADALGMSVLTPVLRRWPCSAPLIPTARRPAGAHPDRRARPLPAVLARPDQARLDHRAGHPRRRLGHR